MTPHTSNNQSDQKKDEDDKGKKESPNPDGNPTKDKPEIKEPKPQKPMILS